MYFVFKGIDSRTMGVMLQDYPAYTRPQERVSTVTIPGRSGVLSIPESREELVMDARTITINCYLKPRTDINAVLNWLTGTGLLVFGHQHGFAYSARISNAVQLASILHVSGFRTFTATFTCDPWRIEYPAQDPLTISTRVLETISERQTVNVINRGDIVTPLKVTMYGAGTFTLAVQNTDGSFTDAHVSGVNNGVLIDWDAQEAYYLDNLGQPSEVATGNLVVYRNGILVYERQMMQPGSNVVTWSLESNGAIRAVNVAQNWRWFG